jgi:hypothetical protein
MALSYDDLHPSALAPVPVIIWRDLFILVDKGHSKASDYAILERMVIEQSSKYPGGLGCLVIIPATASPPPDDVREAIKGVLRRLAPKLRGLCWVVEGTGFKAAIARAVLTGLQILNRTPYSTHVASDMTSALSWVLARVTPTTSRINEVPAALQAVRQGRGSSHPTTARVAAVAR